MEKSVIKLDGCDDVKISDVMGVGSDIHHVVSAKDTTRLSVERAAMYSGVVDGILPHLQAIPGGDHFTAQDVLDLMAAPPKDATSFWKTGVGAFLKGAASGSGGLAATALIKVLALKLGISIP